MKALLSFLRVPHEPVPPVGSHDVRTFRAAPNYFRYNVIVWAATQAGALLGLIIGTFVLVRFGRQLNRTLLMWLRLGELAGWLLFLLQVVFSYLMRKLDYQLRWYIVTDRSLRIREGLMTVDEKTMTFANIQNMTIRQGPVQRLLKIADLEVTTAGGGEGGAEAHSKPGLGKNLHTAYFRGVDNAEAIRDLVRERVRLHRDAGLGDLDDPLHHPLHATHRDASATKAAHVLLADVRALRESLAGA